jgi:hypothetical protein
MRSTRCAAAFAALFLYSVAPSCTAAQGRAADHRPVPAHPALRIAAISPNPEGEVRLRVSMELPQPQRIYSWRGHIYPIIGHGLSAEAQSASGTILSIARPPQVMPEVPHPLDVVEARTVTYEPLRLLVRTPDGRPYAGCFSIRLRYDTEQDQRFRANGFSVLVIDSNELSVCNGGE